jgi:V8-like Glu-specific endopeptidase
VKQLFLLAGSLTFFLSASAFAASENAFENDTRAVVSRLTAPSMWIGKLLLPGGEWCSAGLVYRDIAVTAAHCIADKNTKKIMAGAFVFYYGVANNGFEDSSAAKPVDWGTLDLNDSNTVADWAFVRLEKPLGTKYGWMGLRSLEPKSIFNKGGLELTAYSRDFLQGRTASVRKNCSFTGANEVANNRYVLHDCDMSRGASGAPLYRAETDENGRVTYYVVGINVGERIYGRDSLKGIPYSSEHANVAIPTSFFIASLQKLIVGENR